MAKRRKPAPPATEPEAFLPAPPDDQGLSLDELSQAYANLLTQGDDPYAEAPETDGTLGLPVADWEEDESEEPEEPPAGEAEAADEGDAPPPDHDRVCPVTPRSILEAMLFVGHPANEPLTSACVAGLMRGVRAPEVDGLVVELNRSYEEEGCPYKIESAGRGYRLVLRDEFHALRDKFYGRVKAARLSQAAIDVLAIVAYRQPLTRDEIDELRGKGSGALLNQLVRRQLLRIDRAAENPRVPRYATTERFLELFGLETLHDLPKSPDGSF